jgi:signal transduction histidine kinase
VVLLDGKTRESVADPVYQTTISDQPGLADHEAFPATALSRFATHVPLDEALAAGKAVSVPYADPERGAPFIVLAVKVPGPMKDGVEQPWVVAVELSLRRLNERFAEASDEGLTQAQEAMSRSDLAGNPGVQALFSTASPASGVVNLEDPEAASLIAYARLSRLASAQGRTWGVVVERDRDAALAGLSSVLRQVVFWVAAALVLAILAGIVLARGVVEPVEILTRVVGRFASDDDKRGQVRAPALGSDEIGRLATAFNTMADQIESRDRQLRAFNDELQHKVDERTAELKEAQSQLIESQKMAAVGELGAGVAHEINNPLAAVLGSAQLALLRADKADTRVRPHLEDIEKEALRIKDIVENLLKLSQDKSQQVMGTVDVNSVVDGAVALVARPLISARIAVKKELAPNLPKIRGRAGELQQAVMQLLTNAKDAMPEGGTLTIKTDVLDGKLVRLTIEDTGQGLNPAHKERAFEPFFTTRADKGHKGMGLAVVQRIVQDHQGRVVLDSAGLGKGCTARLSFPATRDARQLV